MACIYLMTNAPNITITAWEHIDIESLLQRPHLYSLMADIDSILKIISCCSRFAIYLAFNKEFRKVVLSVLTSGPIYIVEGAQVSFRRISRRHEKEELRRNTARANAEM